MSEQPDLVAWHLCDEVLVPRRCPQRYLGTVQATARLGPLILLASLALSACAQDESSAETERTIEGTVRDERSDRGISGARVEFTSDTLDRAETTSDSDGRFSLFVQVRDGVRFGTLEASHERYGDGTQQSVYFDGTELNIDLQLRPLD